MGFWVGARFGVQWPGYLAEEQEKKRVELRLIMESDQSKSVTFCHSGWDLRSELSETSGALGAD